MFSSTAEAFLSKASNDLTPYQLATDNYPHKISSIILSSILHFLLLAISPTGHPNWKLLQLHLPRLQRVHRRAMRWARLKTFESAASPCPEGSGSSQSKRSIGMNMKHDVI
uniref:Uncharacterized protein n=1 Tax=Globodera rostochiensis TaxID=31243 RepID=A0A914HM44_GLORO